MISIQVHDKGNTLCPVHNLGFLANCAEVIDRF